MVFFAMRLLSSFILNFYVICILNCPLPMSVECTTGLWNDYFIVLWIYLYYICKATYSIEKSQLSGSYLNLELIFMASIAFNSSSAKLKSKTSKSAI